MGQQKRFTKAFEDKAVRLALSSGRIRRAGAVKTASRIRRAARSRRTLRPSSSGCAGRMRSSARSVRS